MVKAIIYAGIFFSPAHRWLTFEFLTWNLFFMDSSVEALKPKVFILREGMEAKLKFTTDDSLKS